ncbi:MAG: tetratricopeptide repeat protein [Treponema sp.]|jgi:tetratricopeptide (TPR) repeat protein|nr:tetratricopeptide repeat protein [Treponema sp.]
MNSRGPIVFLPVPESLSGRLESLSGKGEAVFTFDPAIPIPVELAPGMTELDLEELSWEMILSGMIRVVADSPDDVYAPYYRRFVFGVKPDILNELTEAAILKARNGDFDMALEILSALEGLFPRSPVVLLNRALVLEEQSEAWERAGLEGGYESAREAYEEVLDLDPPFPNGIFNAGFFFMKRRDFDQARTCFSTYIPVADDPEKQEQAEALLREIESQCLDDVLFREAYDAIHQGEAQTGLLRIRDFLERHPEVWNGWFILGWGLRKLGRWEDGVAAFRRTIELGGDTSDTRNELAICLMESGSLAAARRELEMALREDPENIKIISNLGVLALKNGDDDEAAGFFRTVLELEPADPLAQEYLANGLADI